MSVYYGIDIGGTTVKLGMFAGEGELLDKWEIPTRKENNGSLLFRDIAEEVTARGRCRGHWQGGNPGHWVRNPRSGGGERVCGVLC